MGNIMTAVLAYTPSLDADMVTEISNQLTGFGTKLLGYFVDLLPALAGISAIFFVIGLIRSKVY